MTDWHHTPPEVHTWMTELVRLCNTLPGLKGGAHLGAPPVDTGADPTGRAYPYAVVWPGTGTPVDDDDATGVLYQAGQVAEATVTVASGTTLWTMQAAEDAKRVLTGALGGRCKPNRLQQQTITVQQDPAERPARYYVPLVFTITNHS